MKLTRHRDGTVSITLASYDEAVVVADAFDRLAAWDAQYARFAIAGDSPDVRRSRDETYTLRASLHRNVSHSIRSIRDHISSGSSKHYQIT